MKTLRELLGVERELWEMVDDPDTNLDAIEDTLQSIEGEINTKVESIIKVYLQMNASISMLDEEIKRLTARKKHMENGQERLENYTLYCLRSAGKDKVQTPLGIARINKPRESVSITDATLLPPIYRSLEIKPDKRAIADAFKAGQEIPGAEMKPGQPSLSIK